MCAFAVFDDEEEVVHQCDDMEMEQAEEDEQDNVLSEIEIKSEDDEVESFEWEGRAEDQRSDNVLVAFPQAASLILNVPSGAG